MSSAKQKKGEVRAGTKPARTVSATAKPAPRSQRQKPTIAASEASPQSLTHDRKLTGEKAPGQPARSAPMEHDLGPDEMEFIAALDRFKIENGRPFPTWSEVLTVIRSLGYAKR